MIGSNLHLESLLCPGEWAHHHPGVVQQDVNLWQGVGELFGALAHASQAGQVTFMYNNIILGLFPKYYEF